jgi:hypothetical protein
MAFSILSTLGQTPSQRRSKTTRIPWRCSAQKHGVALGALRGLVNTGHYAQVDEARDEFAQLTREIMRRTGI